MSGTIRTVYTEAPPFPATDQHPAAVRYHVGSRWVDAIGGQPTAEEIDAFLHPEPNPSADDETRAAYLQMAETESTDISVQILIELYRFDRGLS
jgi:hypothetical protein